MLKLADLILIRGDHLIDRAIEDISHSVYSHCAGIASPNTLIESQYGRDTGYKPLSAYDGKFDIYTCPTATDVQRKGIVDYVISKIGTEYSLKLIALEAEHYIFHVDVHYHDHQNTFDCSQLWLDAYRSVGIDLCPGLTMASPGDMADSSLLRKISQ